MPDTDWVTASCTVGFMHQDLMRAVFSAKLIKASGALHHCEGRFIFPSVTPPSPPTEAARWFRVGCTTMTFIREVNISVGRARFTAGAETGCVDRVETVSSEGRWISEFCHFPQSDQSCSSIALFLCGPCPHSNERTGNTHTLWRKEL